MSRTKDGCTEIEVTIRPANRRDAAVLEALARRSVEGLSGPFYSEEQIRSASNCITKPDLDLIDDGALFVAELGDRVVACGAWSRRKKLYTGSRALGGEDQFLDPACDRARIRAFFVDPNVAGKGIAKAIYLRCAEEASRFGFTSLELMATLPGVPFYERLGFVAAEPVDIGLSDGTILPGVRMTADLRPS